jgi:hypothetical protein
MKHRETPLIKAKGRGAGDWSPTEPGTLALRSTQRYSLTQRFSTIYKHELSVQALHPLLITHETLQVIT